MAVSRGKVKRSATQAADPAVSSSTPIPGLFLAGDETFLTEIVGLEATVEATAVLVVVEVVAAVAAAADIVMLLMTCSTPIVED